MPQESVYVQNGTWNATTNVASDTGLAIPAVTATPAQPLPLQDGNHFQWYFVATSDGAPHSYANMEAGQTYAVNDVIVADPISGLWKKNLASANMEALPQGNLASTSPVSVREVEQPNFILVGASTPPTPPPSEVYFPPHQNWAYGTKPL